MSVATLTKFTVPLASDQSAVSQGTLMPKMKYRWRGVFENFGVSTPRSEISKQLISWARPQITFENTVLDVYNSKINILGKQTIGAFTVELRDDATGAVAKLVGEQLQKQYDFFEQASAASGIDYKFISRMESLDGGNGASAPNVLETWEMYGCHITEVNYNDMDFTSSDPVTISLTIQPDNVLQTPIGSGLGTTVARTLGQAATG